MKVTRYICDRCGKEVSMTERTVVAIRDMVSVQEVDLCPECALSLDNWLGMHGEAMPGRNTKVV